MGSMDKFVERLQNFGLGVLGLFFFMYTLGSIYGSEDAYLTIFYVAMVLAIGILFKEQRILGQYKRYYVWQLTFISFMFMTVVYTVEPNPIPYVTVMFKILLKVTTVAIICRDFNGVKKLMLCLAFVGVAVYVALYTRGLLDVVGRLGNDIMGNANSFGLMATVFYTGAAVTIFNTNNNFLKYFLIVALILDLHMMVLTGGRKFLLYAIVFLFATLLTKGKISVSRLILISIIIGTVVMVGSYYIMHNSYLYDAIGYRFDGMVSGKAEGVDDQEYLMHKGIELFAQKPILGWGVNGYAKASSTGFYAHSNYVELLADYGIIGTLLYYSNLIWCAVVMWRNRRNKDEEFSCFFPMLISILVLEIFAITFNQTAYIPLFIMLITGYCYRLSKSKKKME